MTLLFDPARDDLCRIWCQEVHQAEGLRGDGDESEKMNKMKIVPADVTVAIH